MKIGLYGLNVGNFCDPDWMVRLLQTCETMGFESVWTADHVAMEDSPEAATVDGSEPVSAHLPYLDNLSALAFAAACTKTLRLGAGVLLLPQRHPLLAAKSLAAIDVLSGGRLLVGVGVGYEPVIYEALDIPFNERGARLSEAIDVLRTLWTSEHPAFDGRFTSFANLQSKPQPVQQAGPPILVGGLSDPALRRAVHCGNGWIGSPFRDFDHLEERLRRLRELQGEVERPLELGRLEITVSPPQQPVADACLMKRCEDLGVDRLLMMSSAHDVLAFDKPRDDDAILRSLEEMAKQFICF